MKKVLALLLLTMLIGCTSALGETGIVGYDYGKRTEYPLKDVWYQEAYPGATISSFLTGNIMFDVENFINSTLGEITIERQFNAFIKYQDEMDPELVAAWAEKGIIKEMHNGEDAQHKWATYTPKYVYDEANAGKTWPVVFLLHGNGNTILQAESWGYAQICADEGFIAVLPDMNNMDDWETDIPKIYEELSANYPVDKSRVYVSGFSKGGATTMRVAMQFPELFTACAPGGISITASGEDEMFTKLDKGMPMCFMGGTVDMFTIFPLDNTLMQGCLDNWLKVNGLGDIPTNAGFANNKGNRAIIAIGQEGSEAYTMEMDGTYYYFADFKDNDGTTRVRLVSVYGMPHWPSPSQGQIAWDFMSQFAKGENGQAMVIK